MAFVRGRAVCGLVVLWVAAGGGVTAILAIDPATKTGWALKSGDHEPRSGTWNLNPPKGETEGYRYARLRECLQKLPGGPEVSMVVFEDVKRHAGTRAAHVYGGLMAVLHMWARSRDIPAHPVAVSVLKKHATGSGRADKVAMVEAAEQRWGVVCDDNEADALWLLDYAVCNLA